MQPDEALPQLALSTSTRTFSQQVRAGCVTEARKTE